MIKEELNYRRNKMSRITKNKKRIDPRYFLNETTYRDRLNENQEAIQAVYAAAKEYAYKNFDLTMAEAMLAAINDLFIQGGRQEDQAVAEAAKILASKYGKSDPRDVSEIEAQLRSNMSNI